MPVICRRPLLSFAAVLSLGFPAVRALAAWPSIPTVNAPICVAGGDQNVPTMVSDGSGGAIIAWMDARGGNYDVYVQRVNSAGGPQWAANGVALCAASGSQDFLDIAPDGASGAIIAWSDFRSGSHWDLYARRVTAGGAPQWSSNGNGLCTLTGSQLFPSMVADGVGGAIVAWQDARGGAVSDIYAQRVSAAGGALWAPNGIALCTAAGDQLGPVAVSNGSSGAIVVWRDRRNGSTDDLFGARVESSGSLIWDADGVAISTETGHQSNPALIADGAGGAICVWEDYRGGANPDIYGQRMNAAGGLQWAATAVAISTAAISQQVPSLAPDGAGGAIAAWRDTRNSNGDIYAQRLDRSGALGGDPSLGAEDRVVSGLWLGRPAPNPAPGATTLRYALPRETAVSLTVHDLAGRLERVLVGGVRAAGDHTASWDGRDASGRAVASGLYFIWLEALGARTAQSVIAIR